MKQSPMPRRRTPLQARKPMSRGKGLDPGKPMERKAGMRRSAGLPRAERKRGPARDTGPSPIVRGLVVARWGFRCAACGVSVIGRPWSVQHRRARGMGGTSGPAVNLPSNLVLLCGSATSPGGCHLACENRDPDMHGRGFWLWSWEDPAAVPVMLASEHGSGAMVWLDDDGGYAFAPPGEEAAA